MDDAYPTFVYPDDANLALRFELTLEWHLDPRMTSPDGRTAIDYREISAYRYGVNVGLRRLLDVLEAVGCVAGVSVNGICAELWPDLVAEIEQRGHEVVAHGWSQYEWNALMDAEDDYDAVERTVSALARVLGHRPTGWSSAAARKGEHTDANLLRAGLDYTCDHREADLPFIIARDGQRRLLAVPRSDELTDYYAVKNFGHSPANYVDYFRCTFDRLYREAQTRPGRVISPVCHSTILGHPWGADAVRECAEYAMGHVGVWQTTNGRLARLCLGQLD